MFNSDARQDEFVANLTAFKQDGTYVDIGSCHSQKSNNTFFFDRLGWRGICVEIDPIYNESYTNRSKCTHLNADALTLDYTAEFDRAGLPPVIDYLSLDVDDASLEVLRMIPFDRHRFRVITIEHDHYRTGDHNRVPQREILSSLGYRLLCADVYVEQSDFPHPNCSFEDWWVHPEEFDQSILDKVATDSAPPSRIIEKFWRGGTVIDRMGFSWGLVEGSPFKDVLEQEFCSGRTPYEPFFRVEPGDVVVDLGANVGLFSLTAMERGAGRVVALEPHSGIYSTLSDNLSTMVAKNPEQTFDALCVAVGQKTGRVVSTGVFDPESMDPDAAPTAVNGVSFLDLVTDYGIDHIDFLKLDCEGSEYDVLQGDNLLYISRNVYKIAGEFHLHTQELKDKFRRFRDEVLPMFPIHHVTSVDGVDIKWWLHEEGFIQNYHRVYFFIDNRAAIHVQKKKPQYWRLTPYPTLEFTTSIPKKGCVVDCAYCPQRTLQSRYTGRTHLPFDDFKKIVDKLPLEIRITFSGFVEPWMNRDTTDMLLYAHSRGHKVAAFTTGVGMTLDDVERIKDLPFDQGPNAGFCLHLPDKEGIARHPITKTLMSVYERFKELEGHIKGFYVMSMSEVHPDIANLFHDPVVPAFWNRAGNLLGEAILKPELDKWLYRVNNATVQQTPATCNCIEDLYHNVVLPNGDVSLCCMDYDLKHILGNILEQDYEDIIPRPLQCFSLCQGCENGINPKEKPTPVKMVRES
jgi:FkbM family methyltransferase